MFGTKLIEAMLRRIDGKGYKVIKIYRMFTILAISPCILITYRTLCFSSQIRVIVPQGQAFRHICIRPIRRKGLEDYITRQIAALPVL